MFKTHFSSSLTITINDIEEFIYSTLIEKNDSIIKREVTKAIYKTILNKALRINEITNKALKQLIRVALTQIKSLFKKCI